MRLLLDTHILIWSLGEPERLSSRSLGWVENVDNDILFSSASIWEIAIKSDLRRVDMTISARAIANAALQAGFTEVHVTSDDAATVSDITKLHRDPFDHLLLAQAIVSEAHLLTCDTVLLDYEGPVLQA